MSVTRLLIIAGSDSGGGAGIQADIKTATMLGAHAMTAVTAITAQNTFGVTAVHLVPAEMVLAQMDAVISDIGVDAIKIGMIGNAATAHAVADRLESVGVPIVFDPVMVATSGSVLADPVTIVAFDRLMRLASVVTPNLPELEALAGVRVTDEVTQGYAAAYLLEERGCAAVLAKGGHWPGGQILSSDKNGAATNNLIFDVLYETRPDGWAETLWDHPRIETKHTHGTGCTLATAVAAGLGSGLSLGDATGRAIDFVQAAIAAAPALGHGNGPLGQQFVRGLSDNEQ